MSQELVNSVNNLTSETSALLQEYVKGNTALKSSAAMSEISANLAANSAQLAAIHDQSARSHADRARQISNIDTVDQAVATAMQNERAAMLINAIRVIGGGKIEAVVDGFGTWHVMGVLPVMAYEQLGISGCPFTGVIDEFRRADGTIKPLTRIGIYMSASVGGRLASQPGLTPRVNLNFDEFREQSAALGSGLHLLNIYQNALVNWLILSYISNGGQAPRGNSEWGRSHARVAEVGIRGDGRMSNDRSGSGLTLTGSGPDSWNHDGTSTGITDWVGNAWEWLDGFKMSNGEFVIAEYSGQPESEWLRTGRYINAGHVFSMTAPPSPVASSARWGSFGKTSGYVGHELLQRLMIEPIDCTKVLDGNFWYNTDGERSPRARAPWINGGYAGPVALNLNNPRSNRASNVGGRLAFGS
ncbi:hypothetical protein M3894_002938 [Vibrio metschnikovii]|nr:hypothetical protein [Vibrio metschnikovii]